MIRHVALPLAIEGQHLATVVTADATVMTEETGAQSPRTSNSRLSLCSYN